jgi:type I restriction enzyme, S subunit
MKRYDSYKDSGFEWMGLIPSNWKLTKNRYGFQKHKNGKNESDETSVLSLTIKGVKVKTNLSFGKSTESYIGHQLVEEGDIVFTPRDFDQTPILSDVSKYNGCISNLYIVDKTKDGVLNHFVNYYWYGLKYSVDYFKNFSHGIRYSFNRFQFDEIPLIVPPLSEQQQIVSFLDTKTSLIDSLIEKTQRKIELLKEKRTSLINEVVTKGLNPNVEMKDSGVEWIGEIPSHWERVKLKYVCSVTTGGKDTQDKVEDGLYPFYVRSPKIERINSYSFEGESVLTVGDGVGVGKVFHYVDGKFEFHQRVYKFSDFKRLTGKFFYWFIKHHFIFVTEDQNSKSTVDSLRRPLINEFPFVNPPLSEQQQIVEYLDEQTQLIDKTISIEERRIELLKEYRQSLVSEVVTGKRKVLE